MLDEIADDVAVDRRGFVAAGATAALSLFLPKDAEAKRGKCRIEEDTE